MAMDPDEFLQSIMLSMVKITEDLGDVVKKIPSGSERVAVRQKFAHLDQEFKNIYCANGGLGVLENEVRLTNGISSSLHKMGFQKSGCSHGSIGHRLKNGTISLNGISANRANGQITLKVSIKNKSSSPTYVKIPKGCVFENNSMNAQNISAAEDVTKYIGANQTECITLTGFCINKDRSWPSDSSLTLTILESLCTMGALESHTIKTIECIAKAQDEVWAKIQEVRKVLS